MTYRWDDLPEWQQNYARHLGLTGEPKAWCLGRPTDLPRPLGPGGAYVPAWPPQPVPHMPRWRRWARRRLRWLTRDGRQTRELRRLLEAIDRQARERDQ